MNKVDIIKKHLGSDDFYDLNGTQMLSDILEAMDEYARHQPTKKMSIEKWLENRYKNIPKTSPIGFSVTTLAELIEEYLEYLEKAYKPTNKMSVEEWYAEQTNIQKVVFEAYDYHICRIAKEYAEYLKQP